MRSIVSHPFKHNSVIDRVAREITFFPHSKSWEAKEMMKRKEASALKNDPHIRWI